MKKKTVIKVYINCVLKSVTKLEGIDQISVDAEKDTVTVVGEVDPVMVVKQVKKTGKAAEIVSVGPPKPPDRPNTPCIYSLPPYCKECQLVGVGFSPYYGGGFCAIL